MSEELKRLAMDVSLGATESLPRLVGVALREGRLPTAGPPQIMIRRTRDGKFWTGRRRGKQWEANKAQTYMNMGRAKQAAGHVRTSSRWKRIKKDDLEAFRRLVVVTHVKEDGHDDESLQVWFYERIEIVEVIPLELRTISVKAKGSDGY